jgi:hypothetical protein
MGRTLPSIRQALAKEIDDWRLTREWLRKEDRPYFDEMMDLVYLHASELGAAARPIPFDYLCMGIMFGMYRMLRQVGAKFPTEGGNAQLDA